MKLTEDVCTKILSLVKKLKSEDFRNEPLCVDDLSCYFPELSYSDLLNFVERLGNANLLSLNKLPADDRTVNCEIISITFSGERFLS